MDNIEKFIILDETYLPQMAELYRAAFAGDPWHDDWSDPVQLAEYMKEISCCYSALNYGLLDGGELIAIAVGRIHHWWSETQYVVEEFCVSPGIQGRGIGSRFMGMIEEDVKKRGLKGIFLQTDVDKPAYRFYKKNGFHDLPAHVSLYKDLD